MKFTHVPVVVFLGVSLAASAIEQPAQQATAPVIRPGTVMEPGPGQNSKAAHFGWSRSNTTGWALMTPEERSANQAKMRAVTTYAECKALLEENHKMMEARAKEKGVKLPKPRQSGCEVMKARGFMK
jgi:hypothetical protein